MTATPKNRVWKKFRSHRSAMFGVVLVAFSVIIALAAPLLPIPDPATTGWGAVRKAPSAAHWMALWPGMSIFLVALGFNLLGDGLRDALDPREH